MNMPKADSEETPAGFAGSGFSIKNFDGKPSLAFFDPSSGPAGASRLVPIDAAFAFFVQNLPTAIDRLPTGALWNNGGVICVVMP